MRAAVLALLVTAAALADERQPRQRAYARVRAGKPKATAPTPLVALYPAGIHIGPGDVVTASTTGLPVSQGSVTVDFKPDWNGVPDDGNSSIFSTYTNVIGIFWGIQSDGSMTAFVQGVQPGTTSALSWVAARTYKLKLTWGGGALSMYRDGVQILNVPSGVPTVTGHGTFYVGGFFGAGGYETDGTLTNLNFYAQ